MRTFKVKQVIFCGVYKFRVFAIDNDTLFLRNLSVNHHRFLVCKIMAYRDGNEYVKCRLKPSNDLILIRA